MSMEWLFSRNTVIVLAVLGAIAAMAASVFQLSAGKNQSWAKTLNLIGYVCMGGSMVLFIIAGFRAPSG